MSRHFKVAPFGLDAEAKALGKIFADCPHLLNRYFGPFPQKGLAERGQIFAVPGSVGSAGSPTAFEVLYRAMVPAYAV